MVTAIDFGTISDEFLVFLRNSDIFTTTERGVSTVTEEFDGTGAQTDFTLTNTGVKNVRGVTVGGAAQTEFTDYTVSYDFSASQTKVIFTVAPDSGTDNVDIQYDHGSSDKIYDDFPRLDLTLSSYPRVGFDIISSTTETPTLRGELGVTQYIISVTVFANTKRKVRSTIKLIRSAVINNNLGFANISFINVDGQGPIIPNERSQGKVQQRNIDFEAILQFEQ